MLYWKLSVLICCQWKPVAEIKQWLENFLVLKFFRSCIFPNFQHRHFFSTGSFKYGNVVSSKGIFSTNVFLDHKKKTSASNFVIFLDAILLLYLLHVSQKTRSSLLDAIPSIFLSYKTVELIETCTMRLIDL